MFIEYADDIVLIADSKKELQNMMDVVTRYCRKWRLEMNLTKTQIVVFGRPETEF